MNDRGELEEGTPLALEEQTRSELSIISQEVECAQQAQAQT